MVTNRTTFTDYIFPNSNITCVCQQQLNLIHFIEYSVPVDWLTRAQPTGQIGKCLSRLLILETFIGHFFKLLNG
jgi:hypothetical protein